MSYLYLDIETRSEVDVTKAGAVAYGEHPSTEVLCTAVAGAEGEVVVYEGLPPHPPAGTILVAHNIDFERSVLRGRGFPVDDYEWLDTAELAARMSLPRKLEELGLFFWPDDPTAQKDKVGARVMKQLCKPRKPTKKDPGRWFTPERYPEKFQRLYSYCARDVEVMRRIHREKLLPLEEREQKVAMLTRRMNARGIQIDLASIPLAQKVLDEGAAPLAREFTEITGQHVKSKGVAKLLGVENLKKGTVRKALREEGRSAQNKRALELVRSLSRSSTSKLQAMLRRVSQDGRLRGSLAYCGAERTGRWSSMGVQLQNLVKGLGTETDLAFRALHDGTLLPLFMGTPQDAPAPPLDELGIVAAMMRGFLVGPFIVGDLAQIECRALNYLAGQDDVVELFRHKLDPYCALATKIYGRTITKKEKAERQMGKQGELGAGYGIGWRGFQHALDENYDVIISDELAKKVIDAYRKSHRNVVDYWARLESGWRFAAARDSKCIEVVKFPRILMGNVRVGGVRYLYIELPSGRRLYYANPEVKGDGDLRYFGRDLKRNGKWGRVGTYGGKLAENVTQAFSREILAEAMLRLEDEGFECVLTVHDEVVAKAPYVEDDGDLEDRENKFHDLMCVVPEWASGLPVEAEVFTSARYRK